VGSGADEGDAGGFDLPGKLRVLAQEAVAGVDGVGAGVFGGFDDLFHDQVGLVGGGGAEEDGLVGEADVGGVAVSFGVDGDGFYAHALGSAHYSQGYFAAVGYEDLFHFLCLERALSESDFALRAPFRLRRFFGTRR
jgi:hypothetical protein